MKNKILTNAYIKQVKETSFVSLKIPLSNTETVKHFRYVLVIQSSTEKCTRVLIYPLNKKKVIKLSLEGFNMIEKKVNNFLKIIQKFDMIHTSGLVAKGKKLFYECYLNLSLAELENVEYKDLKTSLDMIKNIFKKIKIEEISLINSSYKDI